MYRLLALLLVLPAVGAGVLSDASNDVDFQVTGPVRVDAPDYWKEVDLTGLEIIETPTDFIFKLDVASLTNTGHANNEIYHEIEFKVGEVPYLLSFMKQFGPSIDALIATDFRYDLHEWLDVETDASSMQTTIPRTWLLDENGAAPFAGMELTGFKTRAQGFTVSGSDPTDENGALYAVDFMPDGDETASYTVQTGAPQLGKAKLFSTEPTRLSNGANTTYEYKVTLTNTGNQPNEYHLTARDIPAGWSVFIADSTVAVEDGENHEFSVYLQVPFFHEHGRYDSFDLQATIPGDQETLGQISLGVRYTKVPQPAGHHNTLYLHGQTAGEDGVSIFMNTVSDYDKSDAELLPAARWCQTSAETSAINFWSVRLQPRLGMGLDFNLQGEATLDFDLELFAPLRGASTHAFLHLSDFGQILQFSSQELGDLDAGAHAIQLTATPDPAADRIPFESGRDSLWLDIELLHDGLSAQCTDIQPPGIQSGGVLVLPLNEFEDLEAELPAGIAAVKSEAKGEPEKPGEKAPAVFAPVAILAAALLRRKR